MNDEEKENNLAKYYEEQREDEIRNAGEFTLKIGFTRMLLFEVDEGKLINGKNMLKVEQNLGNKLSAVIKMLLFANSRMKINNEKILDPEDMMKINKQKSAIEKLYL